MKNIVAKRRLNFASRKDGNYLTAGDHIVAFAWAEWEKTREQVHLLLTAIWRFEGFVVAGYAAFFSTLIARSVSASSSSQSFIMLGVGFAFLVVVAHRLRVEYAILMRLADYTKTLEKYIYGNGHGYRPPEGWETFLAREGNKPDDIPITQVARRFKNTRNGIAFLAILHLLGGLVVYLTPNSGQRTEWLSSLYHTFLNLYGR